jgi:hypothetical protein
MINILIAAFGVILIIGGFYAMSYGFATPPSISFFFIGLILTVLGAILVIIFGSKIDKNEFQLRSKEKVTNSSKNASKSAKSIAKPKNIPKKADIPESPKKIQPKVAKKPQESSIKKLVTDRKDIVEENGKKQVVPKKIEPKRIPSAKKPAFTAEKIETPKTDEDKPKVVPKEIKPVATPKKHVLDNETRTEEPKVASKEIKSPLEDKLKDKEPKFAIGKKVEPVKYDKSENQYVKNRLERLKEDYIKNAADIENLIEERLDSFKGTLNQIKSESKDPSIIWSFDAGDVQETMQETILKANEKILMMYPWIRNIDVSVLKKFMETDSKMILQEASLDDDASVELIKLLMENDVKIRTMPHVHTVAIVSDEDNGLIISTDPIYESFEVGVIYKDQKSIDEIERMFGEAWELSQDINLSLN